MTQGIRHGAMVALAATHLCLQPKVDLCAIEPCFPSLAEMPEDIDVSRLIAEFGIAANAIAVVVSVGKVIQDTPC
jgi:hypothetical protein